MIIEHFSISIFGRKPVCRLAYSINNLKRTENFVAAIAKPFSSHYNVVAFNADSLLARKPFVTQLKCYTGRSSPNAQALILLQLFVLVRRGNYWGQKPLGISTPTSQQVQEEMVESG